MQLHRFDLRFCMAGRDPLYGFALNGYDLQLPDTSERHESMQIYVNGWDDVYIV